jgi:lipid A 4'-phosphatase
VWTSNRCIAALVLASALVLLIFGLFPSLDLRSSGEFYNGSVFAVDKVEWISQLRYAVWDASIAMPLVALVLWLLTLLLKRSIILGPRVWGYILLLFLLGPGLLVNAGFKAYWGRARPYSVTDFGGTLSFSPAYQISDQCSHNCSFVSGEGAGSMALAIAFLMILFALRNHLPRLVLRVGQGLTLAMLVFVGWQRVASGGHFLSDVLLSWLFVALIAALLGRAMLDPAQGPT